MSPDPEKTTVYDGERRLDQAIRAGKLHAFGRDWQLEPEQELFTLDAARTYAMFNCFEFGMPPVEVRHRGGDTRSHYSPTKVEIALASWGGTRTTMCHELAHHFAHSACADGMRDFVRADAVQGSNSGGAHGPLWRTWMIRLLEHNGAHAQAEYLRACWADLGLVTPIPVPAC